VPIFRPCARKLLQVGAARHRAVLVQDLDDHRRRRESGEARQVAARFRVPGARQHAARLRHQRKHVPGLAQILGPVSGATAVRIVCARSCAEMPVVTPSAASIDSVKLVVQAVGVADHQRQAQFAAALARQRQADQPAAVAGHEIHVLGRTQARRP
jgi:hypothetical protein